MHTAMENIAVDKTLLSPQQRLIRSVILLMCLVTLLLTCLRVIGHGYFPIDDALRHVAKVVSGKSWAEILVIRPEITMDSHPGWHALLSGFQSLTGINKVGLLNFSVIFLFLAFALPPVFYFRRCEAWIAALSLSAVFTFGPIYRLFFGRPYMISMVLVLLFCFLWERIRDGKKPWIELAALALATAMATWMHGTWYLLALPLLALLIARQWRVFGLISAAMFLGVVCGALLTGNPLVFLHQMLFHALEAFGKSDVHRQLVSEFQPFSGEALVFFLAGGLLLWRFARGEWDKRAVDNPVFYLAVIGWSMGFLALRFWTDWGWPALAFWVALEIQTALDYYTDGFSFKRLMISVFFCMILVLSVTHDGESRWSGVTAQWPKMENPAHRPWLPAEGGILYNDNMILFYQVFYNNPHGPWRYALGFEPIWMTEDNLKIYRLIQFSRGKDENYAPWVKKMTGKDRMILVRPGKPQIEGLEWHEVTPSIWSGKLISK